MEGSKILNLLNKSTNTSLFLMPALEIPEHILDQMGFVNAYIRDKDKYYKTDKILLTCLFKPKARAKFESLLEELVEEGLVYDEYDYPEGYVVLTLVFPNRYKSDYELFKLGKYSKFSSEFKRIFPEKEKSYLDGKFDYTLYFHIFKRTPNLREVIEEDLDIIIDKNDTEFQYWGIPDLSEEGRETLCIDKHLIEIYYEDQIQCKQNINPD